MISIKVILKIIVLGLLLNGCASKSEKSKNTIPYKYRTPEHVKMACENQMKENANNNANAGSNAGNFLLGVMKGLEEDWACDPLK
jgi:type IV pilus biogenesis protein CpaD/CtpE